MAGEWIKMRGDLQTHPKVVRILSALRTDKLRVVGGLHAVWSLFDLHSEDGVLDGYNCEALDNAVGFPGFAQALIGINWLESRGDSLFLPEFSTHNGQSAKRRAEDSKRKQLSRNSPQPVRESSAPDADKKRTREEKRREELKSKALSGKPDVSKQEINKQAVEVLDFLNEHTGRRYQPVKENIGFIAARLKDGASPGECRQVIVRKAREWKGNADMEKYLRPATLFNATKFAQYAGELVAP